MLPKTMMKMINYKMPNTIGMGRYDTITYHKKITSHKLIDAGN